MFRGKPHHHIKVIAETDEKARSILAEFLGVDEAPPLPLFDFNEGFDAFCTYTLASKVTEVVNLIFQEEPIYAWIYDSKGKATSSVERVMTKIVTSLQDYTQAVDEQEVFRIIASEARAQGLLEISEAILEEIDVI